MMVPRGRIRFPSILLIQFVVALAVAAKCSLALVTRPQIRSSTALLSSQRGQDSTSFRRHELLSRNGPFFRLDRTAGKIEFGATANLVTRLGSDADTDSVFSWLRDESSLALSIWDPSLISDIGNSLYRLQVMKLQFVTLELAPWVDVEMKTVADANGSPVFKVQSVRFDPNISLLPGMRISAEALGIVIEVSGELKPTSDGQGVTGGIAFQTTGQLPLPMRLLPEPVLRVASDSINQTIVDFAIRSFQQGATSNFREFRRRSRAVVGD
jgi:Protein of unknown function (DUF1997)